MCVNWVTVVECNQKAVPPQVRVDLRVLVIERDSAFLISKSEASPAGITVTAQIPRFFQFSGKI